jgi:uncharacterized hydrophobic protein (TIGR00271 family)
MRDTRRGGVMNRLGRICGYVSTTLSRIRFTLTEWSPHLEPAVPADDMYREMQSASVPSVGFFFMMGLAAAIATFGLIADSAPTIIGAMIIAPLMAPIMSLSYGLVTLNARVVAGSVVTIVVGAALVVAIAFLNTKAIGMRVAGPEILSRTSPTMLDLGIALAAGGAAAYAHTHRTIANSIAGVAIAVALVPPLAVSGIGLALGAKAVTEAGISLSGSGSWSGGSYIASSALILFATNLVGIVVVAILVFVVQRYGRWKQALATLPIVLAFSFALIQPLNQALHELWVKNRALRLVAKLAEDRPDLVRGGEKVESIKAGFRNGVLHVSVEAFVPRDLMREGPERKESADQIRRILSDYVGEPVVLEFEITAADIIRVRSESPGLREARADDGPRTATMSRRHGATP